MTSEAGGKGHPAFYRSATYVMCQFMRRLRLEDLDCIHLSVHHVDGECVRRLLAAVLTNRRQVTSRLCSGGHRNQRNLQQDRHYLIGHINPVGVPYVTGQPAPLTMSHLRTGRS